MNHRKFDSFTSLNANVSHGTQTPTKSCNPQSWLTIKLVFIQLKFCVKYDLNDLLNTYKEKTCKEDCQCCSIRCSKTFRISYKFLYMENSFVSFTKRCKSVIYAVAVLNADHNRLLVLICMVHYILSATWSAGMYMLLKLLYHASKCSHKYDIAKKIPIVFYRFLF